MRVLLFLLFFVMLSAETLGINLSLAPGLSVKNVFLYLILFLIMSDTALKRNRQIKLLSVIVPYSTFFLYALVSTVFVFLLRSYPHYDLLQSIISLKGGIADNLIILLVFFYGILRTKDAVTLIRLMIWTVIVANAVTVIDGFNLPDLGLISEREDGRIGGPIGEANQYAAFLALFLPACIALVSIERGVLKKCAIVGVGVTILSLLMTASRGGFVGAFAGAVFGAVLLRRYISPRAAVLAVGATLGLAVAGIATMYIAGYGELLYDRFIGLSTENSSFEVSSGRNYIWGTAISKMLDYPLSLITGFGWDTYRQGFVFRFAPHNSYLKIFFELGAVGLSLIILTFVNVFRIARNSLQNADPESFALLFALVFGLLGILVAIIFVDIQSPWLFLWAYVGTAMRLAVPQNESVHSKTNDKIVPSTIRPASGNIRLR